MAPFSSGYWTCGSHSPTTSSCYTFNTQACLTLLYKCCYFEKSPIYSTMYVKTTTDPSVTFGVPCVDMECARSETTTPCSTIHIATTLQRIDAVLDAFPEPVAALRHSTIHSVSPCLSSGSDSPIRRKHITHRHFKGFEILEGKT